MIAGAALAVIGVAVLLYAERTGVHVLRWVGKPLASAGFIVAAVGMPHPALPSGAGWLLLAALALSAAGDVLLVPRHRIWLMVGMGVFAAAHVLFGSWFLSRGVSLPGLLIATVVTLAVGHVAWLWLAPHVPERKQLQVRGYMLLASLMAATALSTAMAAVGAGSVRLFTPAVGALFVYISDLAVARQRFVQPSFLNRAWGLPLYYAGQLMLASAVLAA